MDLFISKAYARPRNCPPCPNRKRTRGGFFSFFKNLFKGVNTRRNRNNYRYTSRNRTRNRNNCPYVSTPDRTTYVNTTSGEDDRDTYSPTITTGEGDTVGGDTTVDYDIGEDGLADNGVDYAGGTGEGDSFSVAQPKRVRYVYRISY